MRPLVIVSLVLLAALPAPAPAQYVDGALVIYGNDKCPTNKNGDEITVCARRPEGERYRIPKELRSGGKFSPESQSWAKRAESVLDVGASGIGSCSAIGNGSSGCMEKQFRAAREQKKAEKAAQ